MNKQDLSTQLLPSFLTGTQRKPLPLDTVLGPELAAHAKAELKALALTGQYLRFARPATPTTHSAPAPCPQSDRPFLPAELRQAFLKLVAGLATDNAPRLANAIATLMDRRRIAPHPFDLERAETFVTTHAAQLGALAFDFAQRRRPAAEQQTYFDWAALDDSTWTQVPMGQRERFLRQRRQTDPVAALALVEACWTSCNADERFRLLACLRTGLSSADQAFLAGLSKDRAPRVREAAESLLVQLVPDQVPGSLKKLVERVKDGKAGMWRKRRTFSLEYPANLKDDGRLKWLYDNFNHLSLTLLAQALNCSPEELIEGCAKDEGLLFILVLAASNERRFDWLEALVALFPDAWDRLAASNFDALPEYSPTELETWIKIVVRPQGWTDRAGGRWAHRLLALSGDAPLVPTAFDALLRSAWSRSNLAGQSQMHYENVELLALLCPSAQRPALLRLIRTDDDNTKPVRWFLEFMITLEAYQYG